MQHVTTRDVEIPALGIGTARFESSESCRRAVETALDTGYRHVDTAQKYGTERAVGEAVASSAIDRDAVFLTTKLENANRSRDRVLDSTRESLEKLQVDYVDLLLIHSPNETASIGETIGAMNELQRDGIVRHIGVSNFSIEQLDEAIDSSETPIVTDQVEYNPYKAQPELLSYCTDNNVVLTAYSPLAVGDVVVDATLAEIGEQYGKTAAQVALRWLVQQELVLAIPKAANRDHLVENFDIFDFELTEDEMRTVSNRANGLVSSATLRLNRLLRSIG